MEIESRRAPLLLALLGCLLTLPALWGGWAVDDHFHRGVLSETDPFRVEASSRWDLFSFLDGDPERNHRMMDAGLLPWWTHPEMKAAFWRPVAVATHWLDHRFWSESAPVQHLHSLLWYALLVYGVTRLFQELGGGGRWAILAGLLYAVDDGHGWPVGWLANRNALIGGALGVLALRLHLRWRRRGWRLGALLGPLALLPALLASESAIALVAYAVAHALAWERGPLRSRLAGTLPWLGLTGGWWTVHHWLGYGVRASGLYLDPTHEPLRLVGALVERIPILLGSQWGPSLASMVLFVPEGARLAFWGFNLGITLVALVAFLPLLRQDRTARFLGLSVLLAVIPVGATFPHERLLLLPGIGGAGLLALFLGGIRGKAGWLPTRRPVRWALSGLAGIWVLLHLVLSPLFLPVATHSPTWMARIMEEDAASLDPVPDLAERTLVLVNPPIPFLTGYIPVLREVRGVPPPAVTRILAPGSSRLLLERPDSRTLIIEAVPEFLTGPMDDLFRSPSDPMPPGTRVELTGLTIQVLDTDPDGRPRRVSFRFDRSLDDPSLVWRRWREEWPIEFVPPGVGERLSLPAEAPTAPGRMWGGAHGPLS